MWFFSISNRTESGYLYWLVVGCWSCYWTLQFWFRLVWAFWSSTHSLASSGCYSTILPGCLWVEGAWSFWVKCVNFYRFLLRLFEDRVPSNKFYLELLKSSTHQIHNHLLAPRYFCEENLCRFRMTQYYFLLQDARLEILVPLAVNHLHQ